MGYMPRWGAYSWAYGSGRLREERYGRFRVCRAQGLATRPWQRKARVPPGLTLHWHGRGGHAVCVERVGTVCHAGSLEWGCECLVHVHSIPVCVEVQH